MIIAYYLILYIISLLQHILNITDRTCVAMIFDRNAVWTRVKNTWQVMSQINVC